MSELNNPEYAKVADDLIGVIRLNLAKKGQKSPTSTELKKIAIKVLETRL